jgi:hypothetical protein
MLVSGATRGVTVEGGRAVISVPSVVDHEVIVIG